MAGRSGKKQFPLRLDPELYEILERWAADELRSVNAHIEYLLRESARRAGRLPKKTKKRGGTVGAGDWGVGGESPGDGGMTGTPGDNKGD